MVMGNGNVQCPFATAEAEAASLVSAIRIPQVKKKQTNEKDDSERVFACLLRHFENTR